MFWFLVNMACTVSASMYMITFIIERAQEEPPYGEDHDSLRKWIDVFILTCIYAAALKGIWF